MTVETKERGSEGLSVQETERIWNRLMGFEWAPMELMGFIHDQRTYPIFQERIFRVLLAPTSDYSNFPFQVNVSGETLSSGEADPRQHFGVLKKEQARLAAKIVAENIPGVRIKRDTGAMEDGNASSATLRYYQKLILNILPILPKEEAEGLFRSFNIEEYWWNAGRSGRLDTNMEFSLRVIFNRKDLPEDWKRRIAGRIHTLIEAEDIRNLGSESSILERYINVLLLNFFDDQGVLIVSKDFYRNELLFVSRRLPADRAVHYFNRVKKGMRVFDGNAREDKEFIRKQVLGKYEDKGRNFQVLDDESAKLASQLIKRFPEDRQLVEYLQEQLGKWAVGEAGRYRKRIDEMQNADQHKRERERVKEELLRPRFSLIGRRR